MQACEVVGTIVKSGIEWSNPEVSVPFSSRNKLCADELAEQNLDINFRHVAAALDDAEFPVRVNAALALTELVLAHESGGCFSFFSFFLFCF